jgi:CHAT domain-containing protein
MWWCPTGPFSFLPIHAAGIYNTADSTSVFDFVVPSYTPSLKALLVDQPPVTDGFKMTAIIQPNTPNRTPLPCTKEELRRIEKHVPSLFLVKLGVKENLATVQNVLSHLSGSHIVRVHFACHGEQHVGDPLESGLILHDGNPLKISEIMKQPTPKASLAFLSACQTAMGTQNLSDEAMHLAASLLFAGFRGVVATMW